MTKKQTSLFPDTLNASDTLNVLRELERSEVEHLAYKVLLEITSFCVTAQIAGSIRRCKDAINDIDIVVQPKHEAAAWVNIIKTVRSEFDAVTEKQGEKLAILYLPFASKQGQGHIQLDLYRATAATFGILLLVRTGSKEHNVFLCNLALSKGMRLLYSQGLVDKNGNVVAGKTEESVFEALGLPFIIPQEREMKTDGL